MLVRTLEPEVMDSADEANDYNQMDHSQVNRIFVDDFLSAWGDGNGPRPEPWHLFDAGTGTALIPIELMRRGLRAHITASDLADQMLIVARQNVVATGFVESITLALRDCKRLPETTGTYDAVISNSIVHHIPEPQQVIAELWRVLKPGGLFFLRDLFRPDDGETLEGLVQTYAAGANDHQQQMFRDSLHAALTVAEVRDLVRPLGLEENVVQATSDRHWTICCRKSL